MSATRISKKRLDELAECLGGRDKAILDSIQKCRYLTSGQIQRIHFTDHATPTAALRAANRNMKKLQEYGLVEAFKRRIGYAPGGSGAYVWLLTEAGVKLLHLNDPGYMPRKRLFKPSRAFMEHTLAVAENYVQLPDICGRHRLKLIKRELEPACWRGYAGEDGKPATLKPDLFVVTRSGEYEDSWFLEVDLNTEAPCVILEKCKRYAHYYKSGAEQKQSGVFPLVVWIMSSITRRDNLKRHIAECRELPVKSLFVVIVPDELETLLSQGADALADGKGETDDGQ